MPEQSMSSLNSDSSLPPGPSGHHTRWEPTPHSVIRASHHAYVVYTAHLLAGIHAMAEQEVATAPTICRRDCFAAMLCPAKMFRVWEGLGRSGARPSDTPHPHNIMPSTPLLAPELNKDIAFFNTTKHGVYCDRYRHVDRQREGRGHGECAWCGGRPMFGSAQRRKWGAGGAEQPSIGIRMLRQNWAKLGFCVFEANGKTRIFEARNTVEGGRGSRERKGGRDGGEREETAENPFARVMGFKIQKSGTHRNGKSKKVAILRYGESGAQPPPDHPRRPYRQTRNILLMQILRHVWVGPKSAIHGLCDGIPSGCTGPEASSDAEEDSEAADPVLVHALPTAWRPRLRPQRLPPALNCSFSRRFNNGAQPEHPHHNIGKTW
ncbi:hypothetical protein B0H16DRAFT_1698564 [Mycena metata]|uniref:Uncharacterized protein n=1 Tax=Mycena metata TaxID=1033252 RepID=A0AAD7MNA2_9AGAR|nr:hypothetical protein B0H16DRAFT_1698564 [Mycena metata]